MLDKAFSEFQVPKRESCLMELAVYLTESFGNSTRIDYGTGHEMNFVMFLACLFKVGALDASKDDVLVAVGLTVFDNYMTLVRRLQQVKKYY